MSSTPRLGMPFLSAGQAQKDFAHNEALQTLDMVAAGAVEEPPRSAPPASPSVGSCYVVAASPTGAWAGKPHTVATYTSGGWRFVGPIEGMSFYVKSDGEWATYGAGAWEIGILRGSSVMIDGQQVLGPRGVAIDAPSGGATVDSEARAAIAQILNAVRQHGLIES